MRKNKDTRSVLRRWPFVALRSGGDDLRELVPLLGHLVPLLREDGHLVSELRDVGLVGGDKAQGCSAHQLLVHESFLPAAVTAQAPDPALREPIHVSWHQKKFPVVCSNVMIVPPPLSLMVSACAVESV